MRQIVDEVLLLVCICMVGYREVPTMRRFGVFQLWMSGCLQLEKRFPETISGNWFSCQAKLLDV
jgi:hypothetical protein